MESSSDTLAETKNEKNLSSNKKSKKAKVVQWFPCDVDDCDYSTPKKYNLKRHIKEKHNGEKKACACGKRYTASALSRHKHECQVNLNAQTTEPLDIVGIDKNEISDVQEHTMSIKVITKKDGTVLFAYENFKFGNTFYELKPVQKHDEIQLLGNGIPNVDSSGKNS